MSNELRALDDSVGYISFEFKTDKPVTDSKGKQSTNVGFFFEFPKEDGKDYLTQLEYVEHAHKMLMEIARTIAVEHNAHINWDTLVFRYSFN